MGALFFICIMKYILVLLSICLSAFALVGCKSEDPLTNPISNPEMDAQMDQKMRENGIDEESMDDMMADEMMGDVYKENQEAMDDDMAMEEVVFEISGGNFYFSEESIEVRKGTKVTINFVSEDGFHDWVIDEFDAATEKVQTGGTTSVTFVADEAGSFEYYCSVGSHRENGMVGTLTVVE